MKLGGQEKTARGISQRAVSTGPSSGHLTARAGHSDPYTADRRLQELGSDPEQPIPFKNPSTKGLLDSFSVPFELSLFYARRALRRDRTVCRAMACPRNVGPLSGVGGLNAIFGRGRWGLPGAGSAHGCVFYPYCLPRPTRRRLRPATVIFFVPRANTICLSHTALPVLRGS